jgi:hypothetical protein
MGAGVLLEEVEKNWSQGVHACSVCVLVCSCERGW